jgi:hypothetical protein
LRANRWADTCSKRGLKHLATFENLPKNSLTGFDTLPTVKVGCGLKECEESGITANISQTGFEFAFFGFISMSPTYQLPSLSEFYLKADFSFTVAKLISHSLPLLVRIVRVRDFSFYRNTFSVPCAIACIRPIAKKECSLD